MKYLILFFLALACVAFHFTRRDQSSSPLCPPPNYSWASWTDFTGTSATGTITANGQTVSVTMTSNFAFGSTPSIFGYSLFSNFNGVIPNTTVPETTWSIGQGGKTTMCFSQQVTNPVLLLSSLGSPWVDVTLSFSQPYVVLYDGGGMTFNSDTSASGAEGYAIIMFPGNFTCVTISSTVPEYYTNITWGVNPPPFPTSITGSAIGCDSVTLTASGGVSYAWNGGTNPNSATNTFKKSGTYIVTVTDDNGCQAIALKTITVNSCFSSTIDTAICQGQTYMGYSATGVYVDQFVASNGWDSTRTLNLTVNPKVFSTVTTSICDGQNYAGHTASGTYTDTFTAANGCDSIRTLYLTVKPRAFSTLNVSICSGGSYNGHTDGGTYIDTLIAANGCDSVVTLNLTVLSTELTNVDTSICDGASYEGYTKGGLYRDTFPAANGCDSFRVLRLNILTKPQPNLGTQTVLCEGSSLILKPGKFDSYLWQDGSTDSLYTVVSSGTYSVIVSNQCDTTMAEITISERNCNVYFPNAFTPGNNGKNNLFRILNPFELYDYHLVVWSRWGQKFFETRDYAEGWNGRIDGVMAPSGTYVWSCTFKTAGNANPTILKGTVILIR